MNQNGFSLLEVLIAFALLSMILLSIVWVQAVGMRSMNHAYWQSVAVVRIKALFSSFLVNQSEAARAREYADWNMINQQLLPSMRGDYDCQNNICTITIYWKEQNDYTLNATGPV